MWSIRSNKTEDLVQSRRYIPNNNNDNNNKYKCAPCILKRLRQQNHKFETILNSVSISCQREDDIWEQKRREGKRIKKAKKNKQNKTKRQAKTEEGGLKRKGRHLHFPLQVSVRPCPNIPTNKDAAGTEGEPVPSRQRVSHRPMQICSALHGRDPSSCAWDWRSWWEVSFETLHHFQQCHRHVVWPPVGPTTAQLMIFPQGSVRSLVHSNESLSHRHKGLCMNRVWRLTKDTHFMVDIVH